MNYLQLHHASWDQEPYVRKRIGFAVVSFVTTSSQIKSSQVAFNDESDKRTIVQNRIYILMSY